jgi:hypothetical protein
VPENINLGSNASMQFLGREAMILIESALTPAMSRSVLLLERHLKLLTTTSPRTGRVYRVSAIRTRKRGRGISLTRRVRTHRSSAPFEPPAVWTGLLRATIQSRVRRTVQGFEGLVWSPLIYSGYLEAGTLKMRPRPMWVRAMQEKANEIRQFFVGAKPTMQNAAGPKGEAGAISGE